MRTRFEQQLSLDMVPISEVKIPTNCRDALPGVLKGLQYIYTHGKWNSQVSRLLSEKLCLGKKVTGRHGMSLWQIFVLAQVRLALNISYDRLQHMANHDSLLRGILGVLPTDFSQGKQYDYQQIWDNVNLLEDATLKQINTIIVEAGHEVFKKKEQAPLRIKSDSFVVESAIHFPTDYNLLYDSGRKCLDCLSKLFTAHGLLPGWREYKSWYKKLRNGMRAVSRTCYSGGPNKAQRVRAVVVAYLSKAQALSKKIKASRPTLPFQDAKDISIHVALDYYLAMLDKHIDLVKRRLLKGEKIPTQEKVYSIFETYTDWISKGKLHKNVELGKKLLVSSDQYGLIVDFELFDNIHDSQRAVPLAERLRSHYEVNSISFDKGFWSKDNKQQLSTMLQDVVLPKKGKLNQQEKQWETSKKFKKLKYAHSAIESSIHELKHRGLDRCPDRGWDHFKRYVALGVCAYNLHRIGKALLKDQQVVEKKARRLAQAA